MVTDKEYLQNEIDIFIKKKLLFRIKSDKEIYGHLEKARHNLEFLNEINDQFSDWQIVVAYYAVYHACLALIISKGYSSKNHDATLCILIKEFNNSELSIEEIDFVNSLRNEDILFYSYLKAKRKDASYSSKMILNGVDFNEIKTKTILFVNRAEQIIRFI
jgi:uncharacterized protein (UPF0332 family)